MTAQILSLPKLSLDSYRIEDVGRVMTPALAIYPEIVDANIRTTLALLGGEPNRCRPHVKTAKLGLVMRRLVEHGIANFKCSTSLELLTVCENGGADVLVAYPMVGANARRVRDIAEQFPWIQVSTLAEGREHIEPWRGSRVSLFIDVNPGMNRTGIEQNRVDEMIGLAREIQNAGQVFRGLHYYDGHLSSLALPERDNVAHRGYDRLMEVISAFERSSIEVAEVITAGTPTFPCTLSYGPFIDPRFIHRASPGTIIYNDCSSLTQLPVEFAYRPAAVVVSSVVSHPSPGRFTCDAGHKTVSADAGSPTCAVIGHPGFSPSKPSEEHLPIDSLEGSPPAIGDVLYLVPRHICPTVNNFDHAVIVEGGRIVRVERVTARGREAPFVV
ncbi:MAG: amino acid aldolase [Acidobacteria bacterium]|nr:MAG: amino acid aldolase [Acidobacteriota bacterium]